MVDDDGDWRAVLADTLADEGFVVTTASDGRAACDCLHRVNPAVVITDVEMPVMDGCELLAKIHSVDRGLPVIVMTAEEAPDVSGFSDAFRFIHKPATTDVVVAAVKEAVLRRRRAGLRDVWSAARAATDVARLRGYAALIRTMNRCRRSTTKAALVGRDIRQRARGRGKLATAMIAGVAGVGVATAAAVLFAALRSTAA